MFVPVFEKGGRVLINFENSVPLHIQIKKLIKSEITAGKYSEKIPSERELMERFVRCVPISDADAIHLHLTPGTNVLSVERIITGVSGEPIEFYVSIFHPNLYELKLKTRRQQKF